MTRVRARRAWLLVHTWLGLALGGVLALLGLTGSAIVFYRELDRWLNPALYAPSAAPAVPVSRILESAAVALPGEVTFLQLPDRVAPAFQAWSLAGDGAYVAALDGAGRVLGIRPATGSLMGTLYNLHSSLLLGEWGERAVGVVGMALVLSAVSGLVIWWPRAGVWRALRTIRRRPRQVLYRDLHSTAGAWVCVLLLVVGVTGVGVVFPGLLRPAVNLASPVTADQPPSLPDRDMPYAVGPDAAIAIAGKAVPGAEPIFVNVVRRPANIWGVGLHWSGNDPATRAGPVVSVDPWTGAVLGIESGPGASSGEWLMHSMLWIHNGSVAGLAGRIVMLLAGLSLPALWCTGLLYWLRTRRVRRDNDRRRRAAMAPALPSLKRTCL